MNHLLLLLVTVTLSTAEDISCDSDPQKTSVWRAEVCAGLYCPEITALDEELTVNEEPTGRYSYTLPAGVWASVKMEPAEDGELETMINTAVGKLPENLRSAQNIPETLTYKYEVVDGTFTKAGAWISVYVPDADIDNLVDGASYRYCDYSERSLMVRSFTATDFASKIKCARMKMGELIQAAGLPTHSYVKVYGTVNPRVEIAVPLPGSDSANHKQVCFED